MAEPDYLTATRTAYDTVASDYACLLADALDRMPWDRAVLATFAELVSRHRPGPVADVGCGPGQLEPQLHAAGLPYTPASCGPPTTRRPCRRRTC